MTVSISGTNELSLDVINEYFEYKNGDLYWKKDKNGSRTGSIAGSKTDHYRTIKFNGKNYVLSRIIFFMFNGYYPKNVDHIDGDTWNNKIENLRASTSQQNNHNRRISSRNKTGVKGVSFCQQMKKYKVQITLNYDQKHLGYFDDLELAGLVADEARSLYHGSFAFNGVR
jgi:hypothetical protein